MNDRMNVGMFELGKKRGSLGRNGGMGSRGNLGLRVGLMLVFVGSCGSAKRHERAIASECQKLMAVSARG